jgi:hypothetical protein
LSRQGSGAIGRASVDDFEIDGFAASRRRKKTRASTRVVVAGASLPVNCYRRLCRAPDPRA